MPVAPFRVAAVAALVAVGACTATVPPANAPDTAPSPRNPVLPTRGADSAARADTAATAPAATPPTEAGMLPAALAAAARPTVSRAPFGKLPTGEAVEKFTLNSGNGVVVEAINYGGIITAVRLPDRSGQVADVAPGHDSLGGYLAASPYFGAIVGRYGNRIAGGRFTLDGKTYQLPKNDGPNTLHGGTRGLDKVVWTAAPFARADGAGVVLRHTSPDGDQGFPGALSATVTYTLTPRNELRVDYAITTTKATPVNLTQHAYWNLAGAGNGDILGHRLTLDAAATTPVDSTLIPTGQIATVAGTPFDFRTPTAIGARIGQADTQLKYGRGYDHNWVLDRRGRTGLVHAAKLVDPASGRALDISTTEPGIQFYSGNFLDGTIHGKDGRVYNHRSAVALETQHYPDSPNHPNFPTTILRPGRTYRSQTVFAFGVEK